jgi:hypothetical protein
MILPVNNQFYSYRPSENIDIWTPNVHHTLNVKHTTKDNVTLHGIFKESTENENRNISERSLVIYCGGNCDELHTDYFPFPFALDGEPFEGHDILWFAYRGTGPSEGNFGTHQQNVSDAIEIYKRAQKEGYTDITFIGLSFGGKVVCDAKAALLKENKENKELKIPLVAAHTFSTMDEVLSGNLEGSNRAALKNISSFLFKTVGHQHKRLTDEQWHNKMGNDNTIIGGHDYDTLMNRHMALADVFKLRDEIDPEIDPEDTPPTKIDEKYQLTRVIIDSKPHGDVDWTVLYRQPLPEAAAQTAAS